MARNYRNVSAYEKEILELKSQGYTLRQIGEKYGFSYEQLHNFISRHNAKQRIQLKTKLTPAEYRSQFVS